MMEDMGGGLVGARPTALNVAPTPAPVAAAMPVSTPELAGEVDVRRLIATWAAAWAARDVEAYLAHYAPDFVPEGGIGRDAWVRQRQERIGKASAPSVDVRDLTVTDAGSATLEVRFRQDYAAGTYRDASDKLLVWKQQRDGRWLIVRESARRLAAGQ